MAVDAQDPVDVAGYARGDVLQDSDQLGQFASPGIAQGRAARGKQQLRRQHETIADDLHRRVRAERLAQAPEEVRSILAQLVDLARQRDVEALAEVPYLLGLGGLGGLGCAQCQPDLVELQSQVVELARQQRDLCPRVGIELALFRDVLVTLRDQRRQRLDADVALLDVALGQQRRFALCRQFRVERLAAVALDAKIGTALVEFGCELADVGLETIAQLAQGVDVLLQARGQQQLLPDLVALVGVVRLQLFDAHGQRLLVTGQRIDAQVEGFRLALQVAGALLLQSEQVGQFDDALVHDVELGLLVA